MRVPLCGTAEVTKAVESEFVWYTTFRSDISAMLTGEQVIVANRGTYHACTS